MTRRRTVLNLKSFVKAQCLRTTNTFFKKTDAIKKSRTPDDNGIKKTRTMIYDFSDPVILSNNIDIEIQLNADKIIKSQRKISLTDLMVLLNSMTLYMN